MSTDVSKLVGGRAPPLPEYTGTSPSTMTESPAAWAAVYRQARVAASASGSILEGNNTEKLPGPVGPKQ